MATVSGLHILFWMLLWGSLIRVFELKFKDSNNVLGSAARTLAIAY